MSAIGGPGGIGGPKGPGGARGPDAGAIPDELGPTDEAPRASEVQPGASVAGTAGAGAAGGAGDIDAVVAELAAGRLTPHEAIERLVDQLTGSPELAGLAELAELDRTELRELMADLVAHDPYLAALAGRI